MSAPQRLRFTNAHLFGPVDDWRPGWLLTEGRRIHLMGPGQPPPFPKGSVSQQIDAIGKILLPGFMDLHVHGAMGHDTMDASPEGLRAMAQFYARHGVTAFLPTTWTASRRDIMQALRAVAQTMGPIPGGATILGAYLEGPYLNPAKRGAHNPSYLRQPDLSAVARWSHTRGVRRRHLLRHASLQRHATSGAPRSRPRWRAAHRSASPVGVIPDGIHLHPSVVKLIWQAKGAAGVNVVTDAMAALGMPPGKYELGGIEVAVDETSARLSDGRLAGSILSLDQAVCNLVGFTGCSLSEAVSTVTTVPAKVLGLTDRGRIAPGCIADLVLLTPELKVVKTIVNGKVALE